MEQSIEGTLAKYLEFKIFELFRNRLVNIITPHCRKDSFEEDLYKHLFLCPSQTSKERNFQLHGVLSPFVCMWRTSLLEWNEDFYSRSILPRDFYYYDNEGQEKTENGFLYDIKFTIELFSSSYYKDFRDKINQSLLDLDRLRYFDFDVKELLNDCSEMKTRAEVFLEGLQSTDKVDSKENRSFDLSAKYTVKMSIPYCRDFDYIKGIEVYVNENKIYERINE